MAPRHSTTVAIIGAGASGALTAIQLMRRADAAGSRVDIRLVDPASTTGRGIAYRTEHPEHLLNVPVGRMGVVPGAPGHFSGWLERTKGITDPDAFVPRGWFGAYVEASLAEVAATSRSKLERVTATVTEIHRREVDSTIRLETGDRFRASHVVLALGSPGGPNQLLPSALLDSEHFVADPWAPGALDDMARSAGDVLVLGTGLTMVDVALAIHRPDRTVTAISRRGLLPLGHASGAISRIAPPLVPAEPLSLEQLQAMVVGHVQGAVASGACWQDAIDSLRPVTNRLWSRLTHADQERFVTGPLRKWEVVRHRMAPDIAARFAALVRTGAVVVRAGEVVEAVEADGGITVRLVDGTMTKVATVVSCIGPVSVRSSVGPLGDLVSNLENEGAVVLHPLGMGLLVDDTGRALGATGEADPPIYVVGPLRRGVLWETTAVPEIVVQTDEVAAHIIAGTPTERSRRRPVDLYGQSLTTTGAAADLFNEGLGRLLRVQSGALEAFERSVEIDPGFAVGHAALAMMGHEFDLEVDVARHLELAQRATEFGATSRERDLVQAIRRRTAGDSLSLIRHIEDNPRDALAVLVVVPTIAFSGAYDISDDAWALLDRIAPHYGQDWWIDGLLAFARQEQGRFNEALDRAERSLGKEPRAGVAAHALAHVHLETGEYRTGLEWIDEWIIGDGRDAMHLAHFAWHAAIFELALDDTDAVLTRLRSQLSPRAVRGTRAMVDTATLMWRLYIEDGIVATNSQELLEVAGSELGDPSTPFSAMHAALTWAVIGDVGGLRRLEHRCRQSRCEVTATVVAQLALGLRLLLTGQDDEAATVLLGLLPNLAPLGGSIAQRSVIEDTAIAALVRAGDAALAVSMLDHRLARRARPRDVVLRARAGLAAASPKGRGAG